MKKYILRNKLTGFFFNGTNFSAECPYGRFSNGEGVEADAGTAAIVFKGEPHEAAIKSIWGENTQIIEVTSVQLDLFKESAKCEARARSQFREGIRVREQSSCRFAAPHFAAATRLHNRSNRLALEAYSTFPKCGRAA